MALSTTYITVPFLVGARGALHPGVPVVPVQESGATDGLYFRAAGIPTYGVSGVFIKDSDSFAHGLDERVPVQSFYDELEHWKTIIEAIAGLFLAGVIAEDGTVLGKMAERSARVLGDGRTYSYVLHEGEPGVRILQNDVRAIQLAKAALYAGASLVMERFGVERV